MRRGREGSLDTTVSRRSLLTASFAGLILSLARPGNIGADTPLPAEPDIIKIIDAPLKSTGTPPGNRFGVTPAARSLEIPSDAEVTVRFSAAASLDLTGPSSIKGSGLFIENGLRVGDSNFSRTLIARIANPEGDTWGIGQLVGDRIEKILEIAAGSENLDFDVNYSQSGREGTIGVNGEANLGFSLRHSIYGPVSRTNRLVFAAYSQGEAISTISNLEATLKTV